MPISFLHKPDREFWWTLGATLVGGILLKLFSRRAKVGDIFTLRDFAVGLDLLLVAFVRCSVGWAKLYVSLDEILRSRGPYETAIKLHDKEAWAACLWGLLLFALIGTAWFVKCVGWEQDDKTIRPIQGVAIPIGVGILALWKVYGAIL